MYLVMRGRQFEARHDIPKHLREHFGKSRFQELLGTDERKAAERRAAVLKVQWSTAIEKAQSGTIDHIEKDADFWRRHLNEASSDEERAVIRSMVADEAQGRIEKAMRRAGIEHEDDPRVEDLPEASDAMRFFDVATGAAVRLDEHLEEWLATLNNEPKSVDMKRSSILKFAKEFPLVSDVKRKEVQRWVNRQADEKKAVATIRRALSELRGYWAYLGAIEVVSEDALPFERLSLPKPNKRDEVLRERRPFKAEEVSKLLGAAIERGEDQLADLIRLGMWTGARLEELCALKTDKVGDGFFSVEDAKTKAGWRAVPIHPKLTDTLARLVAASSDGYVLSGLTTNKYGDRSNAIGKRFGRLKKEMGFPETQVFHSIRHTVAYQFKNAGIQEAIAADILGHDYDGITFGVYANEQAKLEKLAEVIRTLAYPN